MLAAPQPLQVNRFRVEAGDRGFSMWQRVCIRSQVLRGTLPPVGVSQGVAFWGEVLDTVRDAIAVRRQQVLKEKTEDQKAQLNNEMYYGNKKRTSEEVLFL